MIKVILLIVLTVAGVVCQVPSEIIIVGTVHEPTGMLSETDVANLLSRLKPDLILLELDPSFFSADGALINNYRSVSLETRAATGLQIEMRPFDIEGRNKFYSDAHYFEREMSLNQEISRLRVSGGLSAEAAALYDALTGFAAVRDACGKGTIETLNSSVCDTAIEKKEYYGFEGISRIIDLTPALKDYRSFWSTAQDFWKRRSEAMATNIISAVHQLHPRRAVVLTGFEHRFRLRRALGSAAKQDFVVKESWDIR